MQIYFFFPSMMITLGVYPESKCSEDNAGCVRVKSGLLETELQSSRWRLKSVLSISSSLQAQKKQEKVWEEDHCFICNDAGHNILASV